MNYKLSYVFFFASHSLFRLFSEFFEKGVLICVFYVVYACKENEMIERDKYFKLSYSIEYFLWSEACEFNYYSKKIL